MGQSVFEEDIITKIPTLINQGTVDFTKYDITEKELEVISLIAEGLSNKEIANQLFLSEGTVRNQLSVILDKLNLKNRTQLAIFYFKH